MRPDDTAEVIRERLGVYEAQTAPVAEAYRERGLLQRVDGTRRHHLAIYAHQRLDLLIAARLGL